MYRRYRELLARGAFDRLTDVISEDFVETCVGLTGWTAGLDVALQNLQAGLVRGFSRFETKEFDVVEHDGLLTIRGENSASHTGPFLGVEPTGRSISWEFVDMYRAGADGRLNWHFFVTDWNFVRLQLLGTAPDLPKTPTHRAILAEQLRSTVSKASSYLPDGFHTLTIHLTVRGAAEYIEFLERSFDAVELSRSTAQDGRLLNASVRVANSVLMLNDIFPEFGGDAYRSGRAVRLTLFLPDADAGWAKALAAGCKVVSPIRDQFWGDRYGEVEDPFGFVWAIATHLEDLSPSEIDARRQAMFGGAGSVRLESPSRR
jgi:uncharacterized glyoxalase superfamily protein PhnB